jgi:hypothetical protein
MDHANNALPRTVRFLTMDDTSWPHPWIARVNRAFAAKKVLNSERTAGAMDEFQRIQPVVRDFAASTLAAIPNLFGKLAYLASLRDLASGRYQHSGLAALYPPDAVEEALKFCHHEIFQKVLETPLCVQGQHLGECLEGMSGTNARTVAYWRQMESYRIFPPEDAPQYLRELFFSNLRVLLAILEPTQANDPGSG